MSPSERDWNRMTDLFLAAREQPPDSVAAWLEAQTAGDAAIRDEVLSLLAADKQHEQLSAAPPVLPTSEPAAPADSHDRFGPYQAERLLGHGGMGAVYLARRADGEFDQTVAVKVMAANLAGEDFLRRFRNERQLLADLTHPNVTRLLDGGVSASGNPYLVMEYVEGLPLDRYCDQARLAIAARLRLFLQLCEAVAFAHRNLILHRDLKPSNVLVTPAGVVKLLDFGTAALMATDAGVTTTRDVMLTPRYASPEQLRGARSTVAGDVFSLGVILYELLTGAWPFGNPDSVVGALERATGNAEPAPPFTVLTAEAAEHRSIPVHRLRRLLEGDLAAVTLKALEHDPARRYVSVRQLSADVAAWIEGRPVEARPQTTVYRAGKFLRRHWLPVGAAALFVASISAAAIVAASEARTARAEAQKSEQVNRFLTEMLSSAGRFNFDPNKYTVSQMLDAADQRLEKGPRGDPRTEAILRRSLASSYYALGRYDKAKFHLDRAAATLRALGDQRELAATLHVQEQVAVGEGRYEAAAGLLESEIEILRRLGRSAPPLLVFRAKAELARVLSFDMHCQLERARALYRDAISLAAHEPSIPRTEVAGALTGSGTLLGEGQDGEAEAVFRDALAVGRKEAPGGVWEFDPLYELTVLYGRRQDYRAAREYARQLVDLNLRNVGPDSAATAQARMVWAHYAAARPGIPPPPWTA